MAEVQFLSCARIRTHCFFTSQDSRKLELTLVCPSSDPHFVQRQPFTALALLHVHVDVSNADASLLTSGIGWLFCTQHRRVHPCQSTANALQGQLESFGSSARSTARPVTAPLSSVTRPTRTVTTPIPHSQPPDSNVSVDELPYSYELYLRPVDVLDAF